jgi:hypothetical protein
LDAPDEYAALFEAVWPHEGDRRAYIDAKIRGAKPSYGHFAIATLMLAGLTKIVWTTNFDTLIADACAKVYDGTGPLTTVALDAPDLAGELIGARRWPIEIKLHGDFRSRRLKNTNDELRQQDAQLRRILVDASRQEGLVVAGYSGRDESVMTTLAEVLEQPRPFPGGLFWLHRGNSAPMPGVTSLLSLATERGVDGGLVKVVNFDETLRDLIRLIPALDTTVLDTFASERRWWTPAARASGAIGFPVVRLNALPITVAPSVCRRVVCSIGGHAQAREAVQASGVNVLVGRTRAGVLAFGSDSDVRTAFRDFDITEFDLHAIEPHRLRYDSGERGLLRQAVSCALAREYNLDIIRRRSVDLLTPTQPDDPAWNSLRSLVGRMSGTVERHPEIGWREGFGSRLDWAGDRLWLLVEPRTVFEGITEENRSAATDFARERTVRRYNRQLNEIIQFWANKLANGGAELRSLNITDGVDVVFQLSSERAFSRRIRA